MEILTCFKRKIIYKWGILHCHVWLLEGGLKKQGDIRWSNTSTLNICVVLLFLLRIVIRHWTQHARQDLKMLNAMKLINRKKRLQETRVCTQRQTACGPMDPKENVWKTVETPKTWGGKSQRFLWIFGVRSGLRGRSDHNFFLGSDRLELPSLPNHGFVKIYYPLGNYHHYTICFLANSRWSLPSNIPNIFVNPVLTQCGIKHEKIIDRNADSNIKDGHIENQQRYKWYK